MHRWMIDTITGFRKQSKRQVSGIARDFKVAKGLFCSRIQPFCLYVRQPDSSIYNYDDSHGFQQVA